MKISIKLPIFLFFITIVLIYSNTLDSTWHFDDKPNITANRDIHVNSLNFESLWKAALTTAGHKNYRPLPNLSFALNWYFGKTDTTGYHIVNILIHIVTSVFLLLACISIFESPNLKDKFTKESSEFIAILATVLWALNPVHTQAVTYIVQRMAGMAGMFYIAAIYYYIKGRCLSISFKNYHKAKESFTSVSDRNYHVQAPTLGMIFSYTICFFSYIGAFFSKENAVILPLSIMLIEILFFRKLELLQKINKKRKFSLLIFLSFILTIFIIIIFVKNKPHIFFLGGYQYRPFSLTERLLTEPRIVLYYISQIFYPLPERFSLIHDVVLSKNMFQPWTTLPSILTIFAIIIFGFSLSKKSPLVAFAILFYFLNHIIESTIIPLELAFEHRNYIPSMFLFLPVALSADNALRVFRNRSQPAYILLIIIIPMVIAWFGINTYRRNFVWNNNISLWHDAYKKAPGDARAASGLSLAIISRNNPSPRDYAAALRLLEEALLLGRTQKTMNSEIYGNMAGLYYTLGQFEKSVEFSIKSLAVNPDFIKGRFDLVKTFIMMGRFNEASDEMDRIFSYRREYMTVDFYKIKGHILLWQNKPDEALQYFRSAMRMEPSNQEIFLEIGRALSMSGHYRNAEWFLKRYNRINPKHMFAIFCLIENSIIAGDISSAEKYAEKLLANNDIVSINASLNTLPTFYKSVPVSADIIKPVITKKILEFSSNNDKH